MTISLQSPLPVNNQSIKGKYNKDIKQFRFQIGKYLFISQLSTNNHPQPALIRKGRVTMALPKLQEREYTIEDIYALPDGKRAELIDGQIYYMAPPNRIHQRISGKLFQEIANYIDSNNGSCEIYAAPFAVFLNKDDSNYLEPDISVICDSDKLDDKGCNGAPDWIIEIASPSNAAYDYINKLALYKAAGVREYWIVDPIKKAIFVYFFEEKAFDITYHTFQDKIKVNIYDDLTIDFSQLDI